MDTIAQIVDDFDLTAMRDRLNSACAGNALDLAELQEIRAFVERLAAAQLDTEIDAFIRRQQASHYSA